MPKLQPGAPAPTSKNASSTATEAADEIHLLVRRDVTAAALIEQCNGDLALAAKVACCIGRINLLIKLFNIMAEQKTPFSFNELLYHACRGGNIFIAYMLIGTGADGWNLGLSGACISGQRGIIALMIERGATECLACDRPLDAHSTLAE